MSKTKAISEDNALSQKSKIVHCILTQWQHSLHYNVAEANGNGRMIQKKHEPSEWVPYNLYKNYVIPVYSCNTAIQPRKLVQWKRTAVLYSTDNFSLTRKCICFLSFSLQITCPRVFTSQLHHHLSFCSWKRFSEITRNVSGKKVSIFNEMNVWFYWRFFWFEVENVQNNGSFEAKKISKGFLKRYNLYDANEPRWSGSNLFMNEISNE